MRTDTPFFPNFGSPTTPPSGDTDKGTPDPSFPILPFVEPPNKGDGAPLPSWMSYLDPFTYNYILGLAPELVLNPVQQYGNPYDTDRYVQPWETGYDTYISQNLWQQMWESLFGNAPYPDYGDENDKDDDDDTEPEIPEYNPVGYTNPNFEDTHWV